MKLYRRFFKYIVHSLKYINDFFNISTFRQRISTYRQITTFQHYKNSKASNALPLIKLLFTYETTFLLPP
ncbi:hypothetical protein CN572_18250 [Bacillus wiedmannii]|nr:hypothetical protein CN905_08640 [Bacillus wiedmannii]PEO71542.1 hypothetical protein CN572_18250 [Bacillus wiedmannii]PFZ54657.1 hypothetical protein COL76_28075 [Bacillus wiedmannii]PHB60990.1 hypothetical protein COE87_22070 [Bacillus wiedmannii]PHE04928.1 hypothetical protein COF56_10555 [Bacillus wiedmannii]